MDVAGLPRRCFAYRTRADPQLVVALGGSRHAGAGAPRTRARRKSRKRSRGHRPPPARRPLRRAPDRVARRHEPRARIDTIGRGPMLFVDADLAPFAPVPTDPDWSGGTTLTDVRHTTTPASPATIYATLERIGGERGWVLGGAALEARGILDQLVGGPGLRRGDATPTRSSWATRLTSGASSRLNPTIGFASTPRCASRARLGSDGSSPPTDPSPESSRPRSTAPVACSAADTGLALPPSTASCSRSASAAIVADAESRNQAEPGVP